MNAPERLPPVPERLRLSVENFMLLNDSGAFDDYAKTELIDGDIYLKNAQWAGHARAKSRLAFALASKLRDIGSDLEPIIEVAVRVADDSLPEPDIVLTRFRGDRDIPAEAAALVIEVAGTTLDRDLGRKADLYAAAGIAEYWVVDLDGGRILRHSEPAAGGYGRRAEVGFGERLVSVTIHGLDILADELVD